MGSYNKTAQTATFNLIFWDNFCHSQ